MSIFKYKGYIGSAEISQEDNCLYGQILFVDDLITYEADTVPALENEFKNAVDDYLITCESLNKEPQKPCSGSFNVRVGPEMHTELSMYARANRMSLNECVKEALRIFVERKHVNVVTHVHHVVPEFSAFQKTDVIKVEQKGASQWRVEAQPTSLN